MLANLLIIILLWLLFWVIVKGLFIFLNTKKIDLQNNAGKTALFFLLSTCLLIFFYKNEFSSLISNLVIAPIFFLLLIYGAICFLYKRIRSFLKEPIDFIAKHPNPILKFNMNYLLTTTTKILFEHTMLILLILSLSKVLLSLFQVVLTTTIIISVLNLQQIKNNQLFGTFFLVIGIIEAFLYPVLILTVNMGFVYSYLIHLLFHTLSGIVFWKIN